MDRHMERKNSEVQTKICLQGSCIRGFYVGLIIVQ